MLTPFVPSLHEEETIRCNRLVSELVSPGGQACPSICRRSVVMVRAREMVRPVADVRGPCRMGRLRRIPRRDGNVPRGCGEHREGTDGARVSRLFTHRHRPATCNPWIRDAPVHRGLRTWAPWRCHVEAQEEATGGRKASRRSTQREGRNPRRTCCSVPRDTPGFDGPGRIAREGRNAFASSTPRPAEVPAMVQEEMTQETGFRGPNSGKDHQTKPRFRGMGVLRPLADVLAWAYGCLD